MFKFAAIIGGALLMAGVALAGTMTGLDSSNSPTIGQTTPPALVSSTLRQEDRGVEQNEPGEDVSGPCDEPEHAGDARCTGAPAAADDNAADDQNDDNSQSVTSGPSSSAGPSDRSGHDDGGSGDDSSRGGGAEDSSDHGGGSDD